MDDQEEDGPAIGGRPKQTKQPNPLNQPKREREAKRKEEQDRVQQEQAEPGQAEREQAEQGQAHQVQAQQVQLQSKIPPFGDGSKILIDWTTSGLINDPINQHEDTCGSVVFTSLLQMSYNKDKPIVAHRELSYKDLAHYIKNKTKKKEFSFRNLNISINYIRSEGIHRDEKISGPGVRGVKTKGDFDQKQDATKEFVYEILETTPFGIVIQNFPEFQSVGMEIHHLPLVRNEKVPEHALLVVARGITNDGTDFLVAQNSWGVRFGNNGYCRLFLPANGRFKMYWPR